MPRIRVPLDQLADILDRQAGAISRRQALACGISDDALAHRVATARWTRAHPGVFVVHDRGFATTVWAALLSCGMGSVASHATAARLLGLSDGVPSLPVHVSVPACRKPASKPGIVVHRSRGHAASFRSAGSIPVTRVDDTVIDLTAQLDRVDDVIALVSRAIQKRLTTPGRLLETVERRRSFRHRAVVKACLDDCARGAHSLLEIRYLRDVERAHGLPVGIRQRAVSEGRRRGYRDVEYLGLDVRAELDGLLGHSDPRDRWRDLTRDNESAVQGETVLRYGFADVLTRPCDVAGQVAAVLRRNGWSGQVRSCGRSCGLGAGKSSTAQP